MDEKGVSNNPDHRNYSDKLDDAMNWHGDRKENSYTRGVIHGVYHGVYGAGKYLYGNKEGAKAEFNRAGQ